jgi:hypothetical protein
VFDHEPPSLESSSDAWYCNIELEVEIDPAVRVAHLTRFCESPGDPPTD